MGSTTACSGVNQSGIWVISHNFANEYRIYYYNMENIHTLGYDVAGYKGD